MALIGKNSVKTSVAISHVIRQLYKSALLTSIGSFKPACFSIIKHIIPYDYASWLEIDGNDIHCIHSLAVQTDHKEQHYDDHWFEPDQCLLDDVISAAGKACLINNSTGLLNENLKITQSLVIAFKNPDNGLYSILSLHINDEKYRFRKIDLIILASLSEHLQEANEHNYCHFLYRKNRLIDAALCDQYSTFQFITPGFMCLLKQEWPDANKLSDLLGELRNVFRGDFKHNFCGRKIVIMPSDCHGLIHLYAKKDQRHALLTQRQRQVCKLLIRGGIRKNDGKYPRNRS